MTEQAQSQPILDLPEVTLIAATSVNVEATIKAIEVCRQTIRFAACKLLTHCEPPRQVAGIEVVIIPRLTSAQAYSHFILRELADHVATSCCLVVQWDGHVVNTARWDPHFLDYDYIGASWPQFRDGRDVGNGGFSLRSRRLLEACRDERFVAGHPEDVAICRHNRTWLEAQGLRFPPRELADRFSAERASTLDNVFGFHGVWHMPRLLGPERFWDFYRQLEDRKPVYHDLVSIMAQMAGHPRGWRRCARLAWDKLGANLGVGKGVA
jgi:hypothetical protein